MIGRWPKDRPGDKTVTEIIAARPELATLDTLALRVVDAVKAS